MRIGGFDENNYLEQDGFTPNPRFWNTTLLGQLIPYKPQAYASVQNGQLTGLQPGTNPELSRFTPRTLSIPRMDQAINRSV